MFVYLDSILYGVYKLNINLFPKVHTPSSLVSTRLISKM